MRTRILLLFGALAAQVPSAARAQVDPDSIKHRNDCRLAEQVIRTGHPNPHFRWAVGMARRCASVGGALADALRAARTSSDTAYLQALTSPVIELRDGGVLSAAMEIAQDETASDAARVYSFRVLMWALAPGAGISYADITDQVPGRRKMCVPHGTPIHLSVTWGSTPLPSDYEARIHDIGRAVLTDSSVAAPVRSAAECASHFPAFPLRQGERTAPYEEEIRPASSR
jgi:hypothetical protein